MTKTTSPEDEKRVTIRIPIWIYDALEELAQEDLRSINAQLITIVSRELEARHAQRYGEGNPPGAIIASLKREYFQEKAKAEKAARQRADDDLPF